MFEEAASCFEGRLIRHQKTVQPWDSKKVSGTFQTGTGNRDCTVVIAGQQLIKTFVVAATSINDSERKCRHW